MPFQHLHLITPGDHYSPSTGSAIPTVVHGLARAAAATNRPRPAVLVAAGTRPDRYDSADVVEYAPTTSRLPAPVDWAFGRVGMPRPRARARLRPAVAVAAAHGPDAVLVAHNEPQAVALAPGQRARVLWAHNQLFATYSPREAGRALASADAIVCVSEHLAHATAARLPDWLHERVHVVRGGVDAASFDGPRVPRTGPLRVLFVGRVIPDKGVHVLVSALRRLGRPDVRLDVVGRPGFDAYAPLTTYEESLRRDAAAVPGGVTFRSFLDRTALPGALRAADVVVVPSVWPEPFGLTVLEGMAAGAAVIASRVGGIPEAAGGGAQLVEPGNVDALAGAIGALADDEAALGAQQARSRARAAEATWQRTLDDFEAVLRPLA